MLYRVDRFPVGSGSASERVDPKLEPGVTNRVHVHDISQVLNVWDDEVFLMGAPSLDGCGEGHPLHACIVSSQEFVGSVLHPTRYVGVRRTAVRRIVLEA